MQTPDNGASQRQALQRIELREPTIVAHLSIDGREYVTAVADQAELEWVIRTLTAARVVLTTISVARDAAASVQCRAPELLEG